MLPASPPALNLSHHQGLFIRWPKYWSFSISLCNEYSGLISFKIDWFDLLVVQGTLKSLVQHQIESINSLLLSLLYGLTLKSVHDYWKTIALTIQTFVGKVMFLLFNTLSRFVMAFLPRSKRLLMLWLQGFPGGSAVNNLPAVQEFQETQVQSLGWEDPLEEDMATYSSILPWRIP